MFSHRINLTALKKAGTPKRIAVWCVMLAVCTFFSVLTLHFADNTEKYYQVEQVFPFGQYVYELLPGQTMEQCYLAQGKSAGNISCFYIHAFRESNAAGSVTVRLHNDTTGEVMLESVKDFAAIQECTDFYQDLQKKVNDEESVLQEWFEVVDDTWFYRLKSGEKYRLEIVNQSSEEPIYLLGNNTVQSGQLTVNGEKKIGFLNLAEIRQATYIPSRFLLLMILLTDFTVLLGLALVLFTEVRTEVLFLVLAIGFGMVTLFALTPIYGFDMRFQFDSTYVVSNRMLGLEGAIMAPSQFDPETEVLSYYRRACDDYSQYQFYLDNEVSANYTDMKAGLRSPFAEAADTELILVQTHQGFVGEQLYLYIPQAIGFTIARLLNLGMYPMLQLARMITYALFVACMYISIRNIPFGKRIYLIMAMMPTIFVQTVSITRDAVIICMCFYLISKVLQVAYAQNKPKVSDWILIISTSVLLAPCKMVYLPVSFFWLLIVYRQYILEQKESWWKNAIRIIGFSIPILSFFVLTNLASISNLSQAEKAGIDGTASYTVSYILTHIPEAATLFFNTMRMELGKYFSNAIQLWEIDLGSSDTITYCVLLLLVIEGVYVCENRRKVYPLERLFFFVVALGVFLLVSLAAMQWTPFESNMIIGLQGRYLTPVLPLLSMSFINNRMVRIHGDSELFVKACCCVFPAVYLMNMYLWTVTR